METTCDMMELCRLCLVKDEVNTPIFEEKGEIRQIFLKISSCLPVKVSREDKLPKKICDGCSCKLDMLYEFCNTSANAEKQLLTWLGQAGINANNTKTTDETMSAVVQMSNKPHETIVKQETIDTSDKEIEEGEETKHVSDPAYMFEQNFSFDDQASSSAGPSAHTNSDEPPPKRAKRAAALRALPITTETDEEDEDDVDAMEPLTKIEGESEESEGEDAEPSFVDAPSTSADDQPGPSGVGKGNIDAPSPTVFEYTISPEIFLKELNVTKQNETTTKEKSHECDICHTKFIYNFNLKQHIKECHIKTENTHNCELCPEKFPSEIKLQRHKDSHKEKSIECQFCNKKFLFDYLLRSHLRDFHLDVQKKKKFTCDYCDKSFSTKSHLKAHRKIHEVEGCKHECDKCDKKFRYAETLKVHQNTVHSGIVFVCGECGKNFKCEQYYKKHILIHDNESDIICPICKNVYSHEITLRRHMKKHGDDVVKHVCDICGKQFSKKISLTDHIRSHNKEIVAKCPVCDKGFTARRFMKVHLRIHTKEKPYCCSACGKCFSQNGTLTIHMRQHTGEKPFSCEICTKSFVSKSSLKNHNCKGCSTEKSENEDDIKEELTD